MALIRKSVSKTANHVVARAAMSRAPFAVLALLALAACADETLPADMPAPTPPVVAAPERTLRFASSVAQPTRDSFYSAANRWNAVTGPCCKVAFRDDGQYLVRDDDNLIGDGRDGFTDLTGIRISPGLDDAARYHVALHELGHLLGMRHLSDDAVMNPDKDVLEFTARDRAEMLAIGIADASSN